MSSQLARAVRNAAARPEVLSAVGDVYADVQKAIAERKPVCNMSGKCCKFEEYGHRLYVSTLEMAAFLDGMKNEGRRLKDDEGDGKPTPFSSLRLHPSSLPSNTGCPYQLAGLCSVHAIRPFGCRMFFCDPTATGWQQEMYEQFHARLKSMHDQLEVEYFYVEWRAGLRELGLT